jgi:hypothetical protein
MKTALARRNAWMRQLKRLRDERNRRVEEQTEPEGKFSVRPTNATKTISPSRHNGVR